MARFRFPVLLCLSLLWLTACIPQSKPDKADEDVATYFSVSQFLDDQWATLHGQPIVLKRVAVYNETTDSALVPLDSVLWTNIRAKFDAADIGDPKFLKKYRYSMFEDKDLDLIYLNYEALEPQLLTRKLTIGVDIFTGRVRSVYVETLHANKIYQWEQKLSFVPKKLIQIVESERSLTTDDAELNVAYHFNY